MGTQVLVLRAQDRNLPGWREGEPGLCFPPKGPQLFPCLSPAESLIPRAPSQSCFNSGDSCPAMGRSCSPFSLDLKPGLSGPKASALCRGAARAWSLALPGWASLCLARGRPAHYGSKQRSCHSRQSSGVWERE